MKRGVFITGVGLAVGVLLVAFSGCGVGQARIGIGARTAPVSLGST